MDSEAKHRSPKWIIPLVATLCLLADSTSKEWARNQLITGDPYPFIPGAIRFYLTHNTGAAFSLGAGNSYLMTALASVVTLSLVAWMLKRESTLVSNVERVGLGFLFGGACGNLLDRFSQGQVTDFIEFTFINFPVFNCADVFIDIGIGLILVAMMSEKSARTKEGEETPVQQESTAQHDHG
ncbi:MAG: signal peptidase II [Cyanobacteria bacterium SZAS-4]|nr:signal peptidase II [Cyanobacteria bacterium SZAS-4]